MLGMNEPANTDVLFDRPSSSEIDERYDRMNERRGLGQRLDIARHNAAVAATLAARFDERARGFTATAALGDDVDTAVAVHLAEHCIEQAEHYRGVAARAATDIRELEAS